MDNKHVINAKINSTKRKLIHFSKAVNTEILKNRFIIRPASHLAERVVERGLDIGDVSMVIKWFAYKIIADNISGGDVACKFKEMIVVFEFFEASEKFNIPSIMIKTAYIHGNNSLRGMDKVFNISVKDFMEMA